MGPQEKGLHVINTFNPGDNRLIDFPGIPTPRIIESLVVDIKPLVQSKFLLENPQADECRRPQTGGPGSLGKGLELRSQYLSIVEDTMF
jgi:hypothetical protein